MIRVQFLRGSACRWPLCVLVGLSIMLTACGGGGGDSGASSDSTFAVNAGADVQTSEQTTVFMSAQVSGAQDSLTYQWQISPALDITQEDNTTAQASVTLPVLEEDTQYTVQVSVTNSSGTTVTDELIITAVAQNDLPVADIAVPDTAEDDGRYSAGVVLTLDGSASTDADASDPDSPISSWQWTQLEGVDVTSDVAMDGQTITFTTPVASTEQLLRIQLTVEDEEGATGSTTVSLRVMADTQTKPTVDAGSNQGVFSAEPIILEGIADSTVPSALPLTYEWEVSDNQQITIENTEALSTYARAPLVDTAQSFSFTLNVTDANGNQVSDNITVRVRPMPVALLNDTGVITQATESSLSSTQQNTYPGQDGQRGADILASAGLLEKAGRGEAGFDFTKLNDNGDEQDADVTDFSCVRDNTTGLVWEVKSADSGLHGSAHTYTWYQADNNGGTEGDEGTPATCSFASKGCNTGNFVEDVRDEGLCGFYDWRLPSHLELMSIVHFGQQNRAMVDAQYFPNTGTISNGPLWYWTSQPGADGVISDAAQNAWAVDYASGVDNFLNKSSAARVRLVRAGRE